MMLASRLLMLMLFASTCAQAGYYHRPHYQQSNDVETVGKIALAVGCLAAVGYGIYKLCDWLFTPSDEKVLQRGIDALHNAHKCDSTIGFIESHFSGIPDAVRDQKKLIQSVHEPLLYDFAISYKKNTDLGSLLWNMRDAISSLQSAHNGLADRIKKLRQKNEASFAMISRMEQVDQEIIGLLCKLEFVHEYFAHHTNYYSLFDLEARVLRSYEFEVNAINQYQANVAYLPYLKEAIRASVMRNASAHSGYPYMRYVDRVQADCNALQSALNSLPYNYANRISAARSLLQSIQTVHTLVVAEDAYHQELRDYKKEQLERERLEAEKAKAAAAAAQAAAMQQQAWELHQQNQLHAQQIRVDAERNAIMATQTVVNAMNPPQVTVYV